MAAVAGNHESACFLCSTIVTLGVIKQRPYSNKMYHCFVRLRSPVLNTKGRTQIVVMA